MRTSSSNSQAARLIKVGSIVINFGTMGRVLEIDPLRGVLLSGCGLVDAAVGKWYADPAKCELVERKWA